MAAAAKLPRHNLYNMQRQICAYAILALCTNPGRAEDKGEFWAVASASACEAPKTGSAPRAIVHPDREPEEFLGSGTSHRTATRGNSLPLRPGI